MSGGHRDDAGSGDDADRRDAEPSWPPPAGGVGELAADLADIDLEAIEREERSAARRRSTIEAGRRKAGVAGAAMAGAMLALQEIYEGPLRDEIVAETEAPGEPGDIDRDGIAMRIGDVDVWAPPPADHDDR
jgi:hypothetical protein